MQKKKLPGKSYKYSGSMPDNEFREENMRVKSGISINNNFDSWAVKVDSEYWAFLISRLYLITPTPHPPKKARPVALRRTISQSLL